MLTPKARMLAALRGETPDVTPAAPCYPSLYLEDRERAHYIDQYRERMQGSKRYKIDHTEDTLFRARAVIRSYSAFKTPPDWIEIGRGAIKAWAERTAIVARDRVLCYEDQISGVCIPMHTIAIPYGDAILNDENPFAHDDNLLANVKTREDVDAEMPILSAEAWLARGDLDLPKMIAAECRENFFVSTVLDTPYSDVYGLLGFKGLMIIQRTNPELFHHILRRKWAQSQEIINAWAQIGIHGVFVQEVFTGVDAISPRNYDQFVFAYNQPYFAHMHSLGLIPIHYVCGDALPRIDRMVACDIAAVAFEEGKKKFSNEIAEIVERVNGRKAIFGNIDAIQFGIHSTPQEMADEVQRQMKIGSQARGFVVSTGSPFPLETEPKMIDTLIETAQGAPSHIFS
jgi:hypothetical protein